MLIDSFLRLLSPRRCKGLPFLVHGDVSHMPLIRRVALAVFGSLGVVLLYSACWVTLEQDNFVCGVLADDTITRCDGIGELCLCGENRCASPEGKCDSGYRYTFTPEEAIECVAGSSLDRYVTASSNAACDSVGEAECGLLDANGTTLRCGLNQFCFCPTHRCAEPWPDCAQDGGLPARFFSTRECVGGWDGGLAAVRARPDGICPGLLLEDLFPDGGGYVDGGPGIAP